MENHVLPFVESIIRADGNVTDMRLKWNNWFVKSIYRLFTNFRVLYNSSFELSELFFLHQIVKTDSVTLS